MEQTPEVTSIRPMGPRVLIERIEAADKIGLIIVPDTAKEKPTEGIVRRVGTGARNNDGTVTPIDLAPGDRVLFNKFAGTELTIEGKEHILIEDHHVLGVLGG